MTTDKIDRTLAIACEIQRRTAQSINRQADELAALQRGAATHISPAIAQYAANECERLRAINAELLAALQTLLDAFSLEDYGTKRLQARGLARAALAKAEGKS